VSVETIYVKQLHVRAKQ